MKYYLQAWKKYFVIKGRARRKEYFIFVIINGLVVNILAYIDTDSSATIALILIVVYIIPLYTLGIRRMHDQDKSGWFFFIPVAGQILAFINGTPGPNRFGPDPKLTGAEVDAENMVNRSPPPGPLEEWQCPNCNTKNSAISTQCATCGRKHN